MDMQDGFAAYEYAGPTLLSEQPPTLPDESDYKEDRDWGTIYQHLEGRLGGLRTWRYSWWQYWAKLAEFLLPRRYHWFITPNLMNKGLPLNQAIKDGTGTWAMQVCAAGLVDGVVPSTRPWVKFGISAPSAGGNDGRDIDPAAKEWLEDAEAKFYTVCAQSNFYNVMSQAGEDVVTFGTAPVIVYEDAETVIRLYSPCAGEYYLGAGSTFSVDVFMREFTLTVNQIVGMFTLECCPQQVRTLWATGGASLETEFVVAHAIEPNFEIRGRKEGSAIDPVKGGFTWREFYWLKGNKTNYPLSMRGFNDKPFSVARWSTVSNDAYGRSPGMDCLPDVMQLQLEQVRKAEFIEKCVRPPMGGDVAMQNQPQSILPGNVTYTDTSGGKKGFWPLFEMNPGMLAPMVEDIKEVQGRIQRGFLVDVFMAITQMEGVQPRNDMEIAERKGEKLQRLGPVIGLWKTDFMPDIIQRILRIMERRRLLKPMPPSLRGVPLKFTFLDIVTLAQLGSQTAGMERTLSVIANLSAGAAAVGVAAPLRIFDLDETARIYADRMNFPEKGLFTPEVVQQHDMSRQQEIQAQKAAQLGTAAVEGLKTLGDTNVGGGNSALASLLGNTQQPGAPQ